VDKREIKLPPLEDLVADADAGRFDDHIDEYLPESLYTRKAASRPHATPTAPRRATVSATGSRVRVK